MKVLGISTLAFCRSEKDILTIYFQWWARECMNKTWWTAEMNGEIVDYNSKDALIKYAIDNGLRYQVLRCHKGTGKVSILEHNIF